MKISNVKVVITEKDLSDSVKDALVNNVKVPGLTINNISLDKCISIEGKYKSKLSIPFVIKVSIIGVNDNVLTLSLDYINLKGIKIWNSVRNLVLKFIGNKMGQYGITTEKGNIIINFNKLLTFIPAFSFKLINLSLDTFALNAEIGEIDIADMKPEEKNKDKDKEETQSKVKNKESNEEKPKEIETNHYRIAKDESIDKKDDIKGYSKVRKELQEKIPEKYKELYKYAAVIPDSIALLIRLYDDSRVAKSIKLSISLSLGYLLCPIDVVPDFIPVIGKIDDILMVFFILQKVFVDVPRDVIEENWEGEKNILENIEEGIDVASSFINTDKIKKTVNAVERVIKNGKKFFLN